ncbi:MAG: glycosyltransferase [Desulfuromonadaceae bacterium]|nr:glycosyltransferase [Desulfuromonadaceae bacterium]
MKTILCIPTLNAANSVSSLFESITKQVYCDFDVKIIDSDSTDGSSLIFNKFGFSAYIIPRSSFNHGSTRQLALDLWSESDIIIFMTQDSILASTEAIKNLLAPFEDEKVGAVCGRQLPHVEASPIAAHARLFNYSAESSIKSKDDIARLGIKAAFISNSFAAYRRTALIAVGGFPSDVILSEDTYVATKMLQAGWNVAYAADAICYHSHNYSMLEEFRRYFDIGVFHGRESWYLELLGKAEGEGKKFVMSEMRYLSKRAPWLIPIAVLRTGFKFVGYKLGQMAPRLPLWLKRQLSMNKGYWKNL